MERKHQSLPNVGSHGKEARATFKGVSVSRSSLNRSSTSLNFDDLKCHKLAPFNLRWIHGYNHKVGVINLNDQDSTVVFYAAANCGVLYNWSTHQMQILQGHKHPVTCLASDLSGKWLVTADSGPENVLIVWDKADLFPQRTLFCPHGGDRIAKVAMSGDAKYLLTLAYSAQSVMLHWWIWTIDSTIPQATIKIDIERDGVIDMGFNPSKSEQFLLMNRNNICIGIAAKVLIVERGVVRETDTYELKLFTPTNTMSAECGRQACYTFVEKTNQILVGTTRGSIIIYGYQLEYRDTAKDSSAKIEDLKFIKILKLEKKKINVIKSIDNVIVTGNTVGEIRFYDDQLKLLYWVHEFTVDMVKGLSFNISPRNYQLFETKCKKACLCWEKVEAETEPDSVTQKLLAAKIPSDATASGKPFLVRDFIIMTGNMGVGFVDFITENFYTIINNRMAPATAITVHPEKTFVCIGFHDGMVELYNFLQHKTATRTNLRNHFTIVIPPKEDSIKFNSESIVPNLSVTCLQYSPSGLHLACGLNTGELLFLDPTSIDLITPKGFSDTKYPIKLISYSQDSLTLAIADIAKTVCVYKYDCKELKWMFIGKHRAHYKDITSLIFLPKKNDNGDFKLLSIGKDRFMVEYDIGASHDECLEIFSLDRIEQTAQPLVGIEWPTPKGLDPEECRVDLPTILIANDEFKYKIINYATTMTLSTVLGPRFESPIFKMKLVTRRDGQEEFKYLIFATKDIVGLQKMPLDGNPWKHVGMLGHPTKVTGLSYREDLGIMFTIGEKDTTLFQWAINFRAVDAAAKSVGGELDPYYCLIENMRPGWLFQEIRDLFYYVQILCQGTFSPAMRRVKDYIPIDSLPDLMRALGYFPSEYAVENLIVEAKYKVYLRSPVAEIDFEDFVKLYLNHRPAFGESFKRIRFSFRNFANATKDGYSMLRDEFLEMLTSTGECFSRELAWYLLSILCGHSFEDRAIMAEEDFSFLPMEITMNELVDDILGMQDMDQISENYSLFDSYISLLSRTTLNSEGDSGGYDDIFV